MVSKWIRKKWEETARKQGLDNETIAKMSDDELGAFHAKHTSKVGFIAKIVVFFVLLYVLLFLIGII